MKIFMFIFWLAVTAAFVWFALPAKAADEKGLYQTMHLITCENYVADRKIPAHTDMNAIDEIYVAGWLSAFNYLTPNTHDITPQHDVNLVLADLDKFCAQNPKSNIEAGLLELTSDYYPTRMQNYVAPKK